MGNIKFSAQHFAVNGLIVVNTKMGVNVVERGGIMNVFVDQPTGLNLGDHKFPVSLSVRESAVVKERTDIFMLPLR